MANIYQPLIVGSLYALPKLLTYACSSPKEQALGILDNLRNNAAYYQQELQNKVGEKAWFITTDIIADNAWISALAIVYLTNGMPLFTDIEKSAHLVSAFFCFCTVSWTTRFGIVKAIPQTGKLLATRSYS